MSRLLHGDKRRYLKYIAVILAIIFVASVGFLGLELWDKQQDKFPQSDYIEAVTEFDGKEYKLKDNIETFMVLGLDKYEGESSADSYNNDRQADFLMLYVFDKENKSYSAISINRDTMTEVNILGIAGQKIDTVNKQIALAHTYGNGKEVSCRNTADALSLLFMGVKIDHYISVTMDAVPILNDLVGGVKLEILEDFGNIDNSLVKGETVTLNGEQALNYVRGREGIGDSTNASRMKRQKQYLDALTQRFAQKHKDDGEFIATAAAKISDYMISDRSVTQLEEIAKRISSYSHQSVIELEGTSKVGEKFMEFHPDKKALKKMVIDLFYQEKK